MKSAWLFMILVATSWLLCEAGLFGKDKKEKVDPIELLNKKLEQLTNKRSLTENLIVAREHNWEAEPEAAHQVFMEAVEAFKKLNPDDTCSQDNVVGAMTLRTLAGRIDMLRLTGRECEYNRVFCIVDQIEKKVQNECFHEFQRKWSAEPELNDRLAKEFPELDHLDRLMSSFEGDRIFFATYKDVTNLRGAINFMKYSPVKKYRLAGKDVKSILSTLHYRKKGEVLLGKIPKKQAAQLIDEYLVKPCEGLMKQPEVETFFARITQFSLLVEPDDRVKSDKILHERLPTWGSIYWTSRWAFCKVLVNNVDRKKLARDVSRASTHD